MINVSFDGRKLFNWEGGATEVAEMDHRVTQIAALGNVSPEILWQSTLSSIAEKGGRFFSGNPEAEMMIVISGLLSMPTHHPDHPGHCRDYLEMSNFDFDIKIDPQNKERFEVQVKAFAEGGVN